MADVGGLHSTKVPGGKRDKSRESRYRRKRSSSWPRAINLANSYTAALNSTKLGPGFAMMSRDSCGVRTRDGGEGGGGGTSIGLPSTNASQCPYHRGDVVVVFLLRFVMKGGGGGARAKVCSSRASCVLSATVAILSPSLLKYPGRLRVNISVVSTLVSHRHLLRG